MAGWREVIEGLRKLAWGRLTAPQRALLAVVRPVPDADYPLDEVLRLDEAGRAELLSLLRRHGLGGWAHKVYRDAGMTLPDDLSGPLRIVHAANTAHGILALSAYERLSSVLSEAGIDHIPLKGIRLLETLYPDPGTRQLSDMDVLVREADVDRADAALRAAGYRGEEPGLWRRQGRYHHHHGYDAPPPFPMHIEIHRRLSSTFGLRRDPASLWDEASGGRCGTRERSLAPLPLVHGLLMHISNHGYSAMLKWLLDLRLLMSDRSRMPSPEELATRAADTSSVVACTYALALVVTVTRAEGARAPLHLLQQAVGLRSRLLLDRLARPEWFLVRGEVVRQKWPAHLFAAWLCDNLPDAIRTAAQATMFKLDLEGVVVPTGMAGMVRRKRREGSESGRPG